MNTHSFSDYALGQLRAAKAAMVDDVEIAEILESQDEVLARYSPAFQPDRMKTLEEDVLRSFLRIENNHHWSGLHRQGPRICKDMEATRIALSELVNETRPIETRMQSSFNIHGLGKAIITAILHVAYPNKYGVWNATSEYGLEKLGLLAKAERGTSLGQRYAEVNSTLVALAEELEVDLWTLDTIWWYLDEEDEADEIDQATTPIPEPSNITPNAKISRFALERHLHDYMFDNWDMLDLAQDWDIYNRDGEPEAGYEFRTPIGRIDLLAKHKREPRWLVIELKREKSSDAVVGQVLRYIGWVQKHLSGDYETVEGLVVATEGDPQLHYALMVVPSVSFQSYEVEFRLKKGPSFEEFAKP